MTKRERRDAIAIEAMRTLIASERMMSSLLAQLAYEIAEAMMRERDKADERERIKGT